MIKGTMLFQLVTNVSGGSQGGPHIAGWSESWYSDGSIADTRRSMTELCRTRAGLLPGSAVIVGQRYQVINGPSSSTAIRFPGAAARSNDVPQAALLCTATVGARPNVRRFSLRGFPDVWIEEGELKPAAPFPAKWEEFEGALGAGPWGFVMRDLTIAAVRVASVNAGALVLQADLVANVFDYIRLNDIYDQFRVLRSGLYQITAKTDNKNYTIRDWPAGSIVTGNGFARKEEIIFDGVNLNIEYSRIVVRKVGRPFEQYRGRGAKRR